MYDATGEEYVRGYQTGRRVDGGMKVYRALLIDSFDSLATSDICVGIIFE